MNKLPCGDWRSGVGEQGRIAGQATLQMFADLTVQAGADRFCGRNSREAGRGGTSRGRPQTRILTRLPEGPLDRQVIRARPLHGSTLAIRSRRARCLLAGSISASANCKSERVCSRCLGRSNTLPQKSQNIHWEHGRLIASEPCQTPARIGPPPAADLPTAGRNRRRPVPV